MTKKYNQKGGFVCLDKKDVHIRNQFVPCNKNRQMVYTPGTKYADWERGGRPLSSSL